VFDTSAHVVVPCSGQKQEKRAPAGHLYIGSYHQAAMQAALALTSPDRILILSGLHGLLSPTDVIVPYEQRMDAPGSVSVVVLRTQVCERGLDRAPAVVLAGRSYADRLAAAGAWVVRPLAGTRGIGEQLARFVAIRDAQPPLTLRDVVLGGMASSPT